MVPPANYCAIVVTVSVRLGGQIEGCEQNFDFTEESILVGWLGFPTLILGPKLFPDDGCNLMVMYCGACRKEITIRGDVSTPCLWSKRSVPKPKIKPQPNHTHP